MTSVKAKKPDGKAAGTVQLPAEVFGVEPNTAVMHQVVVAIRNHVAHGRIGQQPLPDPIVEPFGSGQHAMRSVMHQDRKAELPAADHDHGGDEGEGVGPQRIDRHGSADQHDQPDHNGDDDQRSEHGFQALQR